MSFSCCIQVGALGMVCLCWGFGICYFIVIVFVGVERLETVWRGVSGGCLWGVGSLL